MTKKQKRSIAKEIFNCELTHQNPASSKEEKSRADKRLLQISNQIMCLKDGMNILLEIDDMVQDLLAKQI